MTTRRSSFWGLLVVTSALAAASAGCVVEDAHDIRIHGTWLVNGGSPAANCAAAGIATVRLDVTFQDGRGLAYRGNFACQTGSFDAGFVLDLDRYYTQWTALDSSGRTLAMSPGTDVLDTTLLAPGGDVTLATPDFVVDAHDYGLRGTWTVNGGAASANCATAGIAMVRVVIANATGGAEVFRTMAACGDGAFDAGFVLDAGNFTAQWIALDASGATIGMSAPEAFSTSALAAGTYVMLRPQDFVVGGESLDVTIRWDTTVGPTMTDADCATAGVTTMTYNLMGPGGAIVDSMTDIACGAGVTFGDALIEPGTYSMYIEGGDAMGVKKWMSTCTMLVVEDNMAEMYNCFVDKTMM